MKQSTNPNGSVPPATTRTEPFNHSSGSSPQLPLFKSAHLKSFQLPTPPQQAEMDPAFLGSLGGTALWTPAQITTALWLDAADVGTITASGSEVIQMNDKSGNARNFTGASGTRPLTGVATLMSDPALIAAAIVLTTSLCATAGVGVLVVITRVRP
jgi:hypothetical protein